MPYSSVVGMVTTDFEQRKSVGDYGFLTSLRAYFKCAVDRNLCSCKIEVQLNKVMFARRSTEILVKMMNYMHQLSGFVQL